VTGPSTVVPGTPLEFQVMVRNDEGDPLESKVQGHLYDSRSRVVAKAEATPDDDGQCTVTFNGFPTRAGEPYTAVFMPLEATEGGHGVVRLEVSDARPLAARVATDQPLYAPGDTMRVRAVVLERFRLQPSGSIIGDVELRDPADAVVESLRVGTINGVGATEFELGEDLSGGRYELVFSHPDELFPEVRQPVQVRTFRRPRIRGDLVLDRDSYRPGDAGRLIASIERVEGGVPDGATVDVVVRVDGEETERTSLTLGAGGRLAVPFDIPRSVETGRGTVSVVVDDGSVVETLAKTLRINTGRLDVASRGSTSA
jgi:uncharacterized protein YfaS (alpha-2-macroglobulin family)